MEKGYIEVKYIKSELEYNLDLDYNTSFTDIILNDFNKYIGSLGELKDITLSLYFTNKLRRVPFYTRTSDITAKTYNKDQFKTMLSDVKNSVGAILTLDNVDTINIAMIICYDVISNSVII